MEITAKGQFFTGKFEPSYNDTLLKSDYMQ